VIDGSTCNPTPGNPRSIRVLSVDDHPMLREGIAAVLARQSDMVLVGEAASGKEAIEVFPRCRPDVTLMDLRLPDMTGIETIAAIRQEYPGARFIVLTTYSGDVQAVNALKAGAAGYLLKGMLRKDIVATIRTVNAGKRHVPPEIASQIAEHAADESLSARELEVLRRVAAGRPNKIIAAELAISESTVRAHMKRILPKLAASGRTDAVMIAIKRGILDV
jgi:DNA-binding NarL/FixJ family response regulator